MMFSPDCENLVKHFEGLRLSAYLCPAGIPTQGYGHTAGVHLTDPPINQAQADHWLQQDLTLTAVTLNSMIPATLTLTQGQFDALSSLGFNLGGGAHAIPFKAPKLWAALLAGNIAAAANEFLDMDHALVNGKPTELPGLKARRQAEAAMFSGQAAPDASGVAAS